MELESIRSLDLGYRMDQSITGNRHLSIIIYLDYELRMCFFFLILSPYLCLHFAMITLKLFLIVYLNYE